MSTAHAVVIVEGIAMLAESFLKRRYEAGLQEGRAEGREEGRAEGREAGLQEGREMLRLWEEWNRRRLAAEDRGERFEEPPPGGVGAAAIVRIGILGIGPFAFAGGPILMCDNETVPATIGLTKPEADDMIHEVESQIL